MLLPVGDETLEQIGSPEKRTVCRRAPTQCDVVTAAGSGVASIEHELLGGQAGLPRFLVKNARAVLECFPTFGGMDIHLDHTRIGRHRQRKQARITRRRIALQPNRLFQFGSTGFNGGYQFQPGFESSDRR